MCKRFRESVHRFRKSVREVSHLSEKVCMKCVPDLKKCTLSAQEAKKSSQKVFELHPKVCIKSVHPPKSVHKVEHEHTFCELCTLVHTLGISVLRATRRCWMELCDYISRCHQSLALPDRAPGCSPSRQAVQTQKITSLH